MRHYRRSPQVIQVGRIRKSPAAQRSSSRLASRPISVCAADGVDFVLGVAQLLQHVRRVLPPTALDQIARTGGFYAYASRHFGPGKYTLEAVYADCWVETIHRCEVPADTPRIERREESPQNQTDRQWALELTADFLDETLRQNEPPLDALQQLLTVARELDSKFVTASIEA